MIREQAPTVTPHGADTHMDGDTYEHPAYGIITMTVPHGGNETLFGSDIGHSSRVCIAVSTAKLERHLNRDWIHPDKSLVEFHMSHAQFAQFITSQGNASGTPITLQWTKELGGIPAIKNVETKHQMFKNEIAGAAEKRLLAIKDEINRLGELIESGKLPKKDLRDVCRV